MRTDPNLAKKAMLDHFSDAVGKLDEVGRLSAKLLISMNQQGESALLPAELPIVVVPSELPFNYVEVSA